MCGKVLEIFHCDHTQWAWVQSLASELTNSLRRCYLEMSRIISKFHYCPNYSPNTCIGCSVPKHFKVANKLVYPMSLSTVATSTNYTPTHTHTTTHTWGLSGTAGRRGAADGEVSWALSVPRFSAINIEFGETCFCDCPNRQQIHYKWTMAICFKLFPPGEDG